MRSHSHTHHPPRTQTNPPPPGPGHCLSSNDVENQYTSCKFAYINRTVNDEGVMYVTTDDDSCCARMLLPLGGRDPHPRVHRLN